MLRVKTLTLLLLSKLCLLKVRGKNYRHATSQRCNLGRRHIHRHSSHLHTRHAAICLLLHERLSRLLLVLELVQSLLLYLLVQGRVLGRDCIGQVSEERVVAGSRHVHMGFMPC